MQVAPRVSSNETHLHLGVIGMSNVIGMTIAPTEIAFLDAQHIMSVRLVEITKYRSRVETCPSNQIPKFAF